MLTFSGLMGGGVGGIFLSEDNTNLALSSVDHKNCITIIIIIIIIIIMMMMMMMIINHL